MMTEPNRRACCIYILQWSLVNSGFNLKDQNSWIFFYKIFWWLWSCLIAHRSKYKLFNLSTRGKDISSPSHSTTVLEYCISYINLIIHTNKNKQINLFSLSWSSNSQETRTDTLISKLLDGASLARPNIIWQPRFQ